MKKLKLKPIVAFNKCSDAGPDTSDFAVFMNGCNLCCPYCMNNELRESKDAYHDLMPNLKKTVDKCKPEKIFISGGEPTLNHLALFYLCGKFKSWGCNVGLSTNGTFPDIIENLVLKYEKIDYVALDLKGDARVYKLLGNVDYFFKVLSSWSILRKAKREIKGFDYEIRTTLYPPFVGIPINGLANLFQPDEKWILQQFRKAPKMPDKKAKKVEIYSDTYLKMLLSDAKQIVPNVELRVV